MGVVNLYVANNFSHDTWVNFKVWGSIGLFMVAAVGTVASVARYLPEGIMNGRSGDTARTAG